MKQFEFRLQKVMETTRAREELQKKELALALAEVERNEAMLERMLDKLAEELDAFSARHGSKAIRVSELMQYASYTDKQLGEINTQRDDIVKLAALVDEHRRKLLEISKDKKILERLKEKRYEEYRKKLRQVEQKFMDELSARSFHNGAQEGN